MAAGLGGEHRLMGAPVVSDVRAVAIPRLDPEGHGVHLAWSGPDFVPLALGGYEVRRRPFERGKTRRVCVDFEHPQLETLERVGCLPDELGTILCHRGSWPRRNVGFDPPAGPAVPTPPQPLAQEAFQGRLLSDPKARAHAEPQTLEVPDDRPPSFHAFSASEFERLLGRPPRPFASSVDSPPVLVFTQELAQPSERVSVACECRSGFAVALSASQGVALQPLAPGATVAIEGAAIDTVVVYAQAPSSLEICAEFDEDAAITEREWEQAEVIASGLTLPLHETDPSLSTRAEELARARSRLLPDETLDDTDADALAEALRAGAGGVDLGRPCDRVMLSRGDVADPFQETLFTSRIVLLALDPRLRRVLGFGFADTTAVEGETYEYRVSGQFELADIHDHVYDVHMVPSGTPLPMAIRIRDLALSFPAPATVVLDPPPDPDALSAVSRRAIAVRPATDSAAFLGAELLHGLACVIDLPQPCATVVLELAEGHDLVYAGVQEGDPLNAVSKPVPPGAKAELSFPAAVTQIRLAGSGSLYAVRIPAGVAGTTTLARGCGPVPFVAQPLPVAPPALAALNLQAPPAVMAGALDEQTQVPAQPQPGFRVAWVPWTLSPLGTWPEDLAAGPPLEALAYEVEHRGVDPGDDVGRWEAIQAGDNLTFASWPPSATPALGYGVDLYDAFPVRQEREPGAALLMSVTDVFGVVDPDTGLTRPVPPLGSYHEYRIRAVDLVGRVSAGWTESNVARLEKHVPPPLPVGPQPPQLPSDGRLSGPMGVRARAILAGAPDPAAADQELLAGHESAVVLEWGWRELERELDPSTVEFRVYLQQRPPTEVPGTITAVSSAPAGWVVGFSTDRVLAANECKGQWIGSGEGAFVILAHSAGSAIAITLAADALDPAMAPASGPAIFGRPLAPEHQRPSGWQSRVDVVALGSADTYRYVIYDAVSVDATNRTQTVWVGVSAADGQSYVPDELPATAPHGGRAGNESSIASVAVTASYRGRPAFSMPPPLGEIPELVSDEPSGRQVQILLDGPGLLGGALSGSSIVALDRCPADAILAIARVDGAGNVTMSRADGSPQTVEFPNAGDEATVTEALASDHPEWLASRYLLFLLGQFDHPDELLRPTGDQLQRLDALADTVEPWPGRYFYRVREADAGGAISIDGAILPIVARVPSTAPPSPPRRVALDTETGLALTVEVDPDPELRWVLLFNHVAPWSDSPPDPAPTQLLRTPNRQDLYPEGGIRLRLTSGELVAPVAKSVADADVLTQPDGALRLTVTAPLPTAGAGPQVAQYWCYALSRDGIISRALGPRSVGLTGAT
jgi:hypothetical protein